MPDFFSPHNGHFVFRDCTFSRYQDCLFVVVKLLVEKFLKDPRLTSNLRSLHKTYVLYGSLGSNSYYVREGEKGWNQLLPPQLLEELERDRYVILGFVVVDTDKDPNVCRVEMVNSFFEGHGVFRFMMHKLSTNYNYEKRIVPINILEGRAMDVWTKFLGDYIGMEDDDDEDYKKHMSHKDFNSVIATIQSTIE
jgi:hypothetical protein